jgi:hypothetical protein
MDFAGRHNIERFVRISTVWTISGFVVVVSSKAITETLWWCFDLRMFYNCTIIRGLQRLFKFDHVIKIN